MRYVKYCLLMLPVLALLQACRADWNSHYDEAVPTSTLTVEVCTDQTSDWLGRQASLSALRERIAESSLMEALGEGRHCTLIVCEDEAFRAAGEDVLSNALLAANHVSAVAVPPSRLTEGYGVYTYSGKNLWVTCQGDDIFLNGIRVERAVRTANGYVYYVESPIPVQPSVYEYIQSLGDDYSLFKSFVAEFEEYYFDADASTPAGVDDMGNTLYADSVIAVRNTLMDRYTEDGLPSWNMHSESYQSTLFLPDNQLLRTAYQRALDSIPLWLNRSVTAADSLKFRQWIVSSCFVDRRLAADEVAPSVPGQFECVGGYVREVDQATDTEEFTACTAAWWKPSVQQVDVDHPVSLSNGTAYRLTSYKIPNHVVIWRVKARLYQVWAALDPARSGWDATARTPIDSGYFRWNRCMDPLQISDAQSAFELSSTLPTIYYHVLTAVPTVEARQNGLPVSVDYDGLLYNADEPNTFGLSEVHLPAGEYYLRMGFKHSLTYSISIYFCGADEEFGDDNRLVEDMSLVATGSNFHFDRGGAMEGLDFYGSESIGYPEYFDWRWWYDQDPEQYQKASAYDTDGYEVAVVTLKKPGNFKIKIESNDVAGLYNDSYGDDISTNIRTKNNLLQLMMYHWCLRPTSNNY